MKTEIPEEKLEISSGENKLIFSRNGADISIEVARADGETETLIVLPMREEIALVFSNAIEDESEFGDSFRFNQDGYSAKTKFPKKSKYRTIEFYEEDMKKANQREEFHQMFLDELREEHRKEDEREFFQMEEDRMEWAEQV